LNKKIKLIFLAMATPGIFLMGCQEDENIPPTEVLKSGFLNSQKYLVHRMDYVGTVWNMLNLPAALHDESGDWINDEFLISIDTLNRVEVANSAFYNQSQIYQQADYCFNLKSQSDIRNNSYSYFKKAGDSIFFLGEWAANGIAERWNYEFPQPRIIYWPTINNVTRFSGSDSSVYLDVSGSGWHYIKSEVKYNTIQENRFELKEKGFPGGFVVQMDISESDNNEFFGLQIRSKSEWYWYDNSGAGPYMKAGFGNQGRLLFLQFYQVYSD